MKLSAAAGRMLGIILLAALVNVSGLDSAHAIEVKDLAGRMVRLEAPARRIVLGEGRYLAAIGILDRDDPTERIVGMLDDFRRFDPAGFAKYAKAYPQLQKIPTFGRTSRETVSVEKLISLNPDLAVFGLAGHGPSAKSAAVIDKLSSAGIPIAFIDFRDAPLTNTPKSMALLGELLGREKEAAEFVEFYRAQLSRISSALPNADARKPTVFIETHVGLSDECCRTMGKGMLGHLIEFAGGRNISATVVPGVAGTINLEFLIANPPDIYFGTAIGSASNWDRTPARIALGTGVSPDVASASFRRALARKGIETLPAIKRGRAYAVWHHFYNSPLNVIAAQVFAKALHPERFGDVDPDKTLSELFERFQPVPLDGTYWVKLE